MKIRTGFVSNSSSSSFICNTKMTVEEVTESLQIMLDFYNKINDMNLPFDCVFEPPFIADETYGNNWKYHYPEMSRASGKVIIHSDSDNTIPYELFEFIESKFDARRFHLG